MKLKRLLGVVLVSGFILPSYIYPKTMERLAQAMTTARQSAFLGTFVRRGITSLDGIADVPEIELTTVLRFEGNKIKRIKAGTFDSPKFKNLRVLDLGLNEIETIEPGAFKGLENLKILFLNGNRLRTIKPGTLTDLKGLWFLSLGNNPKHLSRKKQSAILTQLKKEARQQVPSAYWIYAGTMKRKLFKRILTAGAFLTAAVAIGVIVWLKGKYEGDGIPSGGEGVNIPPALAKNDDPKRYAVSIDQLPDYHEYASLPRQDPYANPAVFSSRFRYLTTKLGLVNEQLDVIENRLKETENDQSLYEQTLDKKENLVALQQNIVQEKERWQNELERHNQAQTPES